MVLLTRPVFKSCYQLEIIDDDSAIVLSERGAHLFTGTAFVVLSELMNGTRGVDEIIDLAAPRVPAAEIFYALDRLEMLGVIRNGSDATLPSAAFWDSLGVEPTRAARILGQSKLALRAIGDVSTDALAASLSSLGIRVAEEGDVWIVLTDDYLRPELAEINESCLREHRPWLLARPSGSIIWIGPLLHNRKACWECMAHRMRSHRVSESYVQARKHYSHPRLPIKYSLPSAELSASALIITEIVKWLTQAPGSDLDSALITIDLSTLTTQRHSVAWRPQCQACGDERAEPSRTPTPVRLVSRIKKFTGDGGHRSVAPSATLARYSHLVSPLTGVVRGLAIDEGIDSTVAPLYTSGFNPATKDATAESLRGHFRGTSSGKGKTDQQAKASALCEAIERYCGVYDGSEIRIRASFESLREEAILPNDCMRFSDAQYARSSGDWMGRYNRVPMPFDEKDEIDWSPLWSLTGKRFRYLPSTYCYFDYPPPKRRYCWADSNGCAAGNTIEEAILQGFLELVERDTIAMWWYNQIKRPGVDLQSFDEPYFAALQSYYRSLHRDVWVLDITNDLGIPSFAAMSRRTDSKAEGILLGFGAHLDARLGVLRALTEMNQFLPCVATRNGDPSSAYQTTDPEALGWLRTSTLENRSYLVPEGTPIEAGSYTRRQNDDLADDVADCVRIAAERGMETLVLDQTRPDIALPVVRVVVPGLRHFWKRFGPGRLYDVPIALGWMAAPLAEENLNPMSVPF